MMTMTGNALRSAAKANKALKLLTQSSRTGFFIPCFIWPLVTFLGITTEISAQEVNVSVSYDTVYAGNLLAIQFTMENWQAQLVEPDFGVFEIAGGPQMTSSMSYSGGQHSSTKSITYFLKPPDKQGEYVLPEQLFKGEGKEVSTDEKGIIVLDNPDQIQQNPTIKNKPSRGFNRPYKRKEPTRGQRQRF